MKNLSIFEFNNRIFNQIKKDVHFFTYNNIIDYSLLIGIHKIKS